MMEQMTDRQFEAILTMILNIVENNGKEEAIKQIRALLNR
ncbi:hypothetical protein HMPREF9089_00945 [Eubacterium brachy ATCC 33089]|nr:hypothetical protein HMPREF9089_00945 [Eubacterium brachy ATCC 33089]DAV88373.1 MAG TPA: response regulator [Caudoviricetes sp.]